jgi:AmmeMemoRadiSam system protein A
MTPLSATDRAALLGSAGGAILAHRGGRPPPALPAAGPLAEPRGAFVTLHVSGELRGCLGSFAPLGKDAPSLAATVAEMAVAAATRDPRFPPLGADEVAGLSLSVSALGPRAPLTDPRAVRIGIDGLGVQSGWHRGVLLPRVAVEHGWDAEAFLKHVCLKAGLHARAWQEPGITLETFQAEEFGEEPTP